MGIVNRRNALLGWAVWKIVRAQAKQKARQAVPGTVGRSKRPNRGAIVSALAAAGAAVWIWRRHSGDNGPHLSPSYE
jgi:hypothetical protein